VVLHFQGFVAGAFWKKAALADVFREVNFFAGLELLDAVQHNLFAVMVGAS